MSTPRRAPSQVDGPASEDDRRLFQLLDILPVGVAVWSPGMRPYFANRVALEMLGPRVDGAAPADRAEDTYTIQMEMRDLRIGGTDTRYPLERDPFVRAFHGETTHIDDVELGRAGDRRQFEVWGAPLLAPDGEVALSVGVFTDITALKAAQGDLQEHALELEQLNDDLQRSNTDLEQFAYAASHDLAEPLRAVSMQISMLARRYEGQLDERADESIGLAVDGCARMQSLITELLHYSRVGRVDADMKSVDLNLIVAGLLVDLRAAVEERDAVISCDALPVVIAAPGELRQVFQNLLTNALKFTPPGVRPVVRIGVEADGDYWRFSVSDNGIGIEPARRQEVFGMFTRLHSREEFPGTGIGLALVKKVVELHGGRVGVEDGDDGVGSRFWFTIKAAGVDHVASSRAPIIQEER